ncbi:MAG: DUF4352 domain-containing protein [Anaerolineales bacterium]|nr:DUF4352 domain-containing protein [Anaerolineales bacterium]
MSNDEQQTQNPIRRFINERGLVLLIGLAILGLILICVIGILLLNTLNQTDGADGSGGTPTPIPTRSESDAVQEEAIVVGVSDSTTVSVTLDAPSSLQLSGQSFTVQTQVLSADGIWSTAGIGDGTAVWIYGSIINYVLGLPDSGNNRALIEQMVPGDEIVLTMRGGGKHTFVFDSRQVVPVNDRDIFAQTSPGLTLALVQGNDEERLVIHGTYVVPETTTSGSATSVFELGETASLGNVQVTVTGAIYLPDRPEIPPGFAFFLVDYQVQNIGLNALDTSKLKLSLLDELGNQYALSPVASQLGNNPPLSGFLNIDQISNATIGFQIPLGLASPTLNLIISQTDGGAQIVVNLPFPGGARAAQGAAVSIENVQVSDDRTSLILTGQITNLSGQAVVVSESDVRLTTSDGASYLLLSINPQFPWTVSANQALTFVLTYQRPLTADTAVFTVLNQPFQLSGLR